MLITLKSKLSFPVYRQIGEWLVYVGIHSGMGTVVPNHTTILFLFLRESNYSVLDKWRYVADNT